MRTYIIYLPAIIHKQLLPPLTLPADRCDVKKRVYSCTSPHRAAHGARVGWVLWPWSDPLDVQV